MPGFITRLYGKETLLLEKFLAAERGGAEEHPPDKYPRALLAIYFGLFWNSHLETVFTELLV